MLRNPNSIPATDIIIEDPAMEPFFITNSQSGGYTVYERVKRGENGKKYIRTVAYPSTFDRALRIVSREKLNSDTGKTYSSIGEYVNKWKEITETISEAALIG